MKPPPRRQTKDRVDAQEKDVAPRLPAPVRVFGALMGVVHVDPQFFAPLPKAELGAWEGRVVNARVLGKRLTELTTSDNHLGDALAEAYARRRRWARQFMRRYQMWSGDQVGAFLRITHNAVRLRVRRGTLLAVTFEGRTYFPALQFDRRRRQVRRDVRESLAVTRELDGWLRLQALVRPLRGRP